MRALKSQGNTGGGESEVTEVNTSVTVESYQSLPKRGRKGSAKSLPTKNGGETAEKMPPAAVRKIVSNTLAMGESNGLLTVKQGKNRDGIWGVQVWIPGHEFIDGNLTVKDGLL